MNIQTQFHNQGIIHKRNFDVYLIYTPPAWLKCPPLGIASLTSFLLKNKIKVKIFDLNHGTFAITKSDISNWLSAQWGCNYNLYRQLVQVFPNFIQALINQIEYTETVAFSISRQNQKFAWQLAEKIRTIYPNKKIIFGGPHTLFLKLHNYKFNPEINWVIGEGELSLLSCIKNKQPNNIYEFNQLDSLDLLPFPVFPQKKYSYLPILSSRGCIGQCRFCTERLIFQGFRQHSPEYVLELIKYLQNKHKINHFIFHDSLINASNLWLENFCKLILKNKLKISWQAQAIIKKDISVELAKLIKKSGCYNLFIGLESASEEILQAMNKRFSVEDAENFLQCLKQANLHCEISLIVGYPQETEKHFRQTLNFLSKNKNIIPKIAQLNPYIDYFQPGYLPTKQSLEKVNQAIKFIKDIKLPYTKSFINNLVR